MGTGSGTGDLSGKVAIVTGAGSGIGRASATRLATAGARVIGIDLDKAAAEETATAIGGIAVEGSVSEVATWDDALATAEELGGLDVVHLNAGLYGYHGPIEDVPLDLYHRTVSANVDGVVIGVRQVVPVLRATGGGAIVATASVAGIVAFAPNPLYTMTKAAVTGFVCALAPNLAVDGITFDAVCPGIVDTPMTVEAIGGGDPASLGLPLISPETIADVVWQLATTDGTGRCVAVLPGRDPIPWAFPTWADLQAAGARLA